MLRALRVRSDDSLTLKLKLGVGGLLAVATIITLAGGLTPASLEGQGAPPAAAVEVEVAIERDIVPTSAVLGSTEAHRRSVVAASIEGHVIEHLVEEGRRVSAGDELVRMRDDILKLRVDEARAALEEARELLRKGRLDLERARQLSETGAVTTKALDAVESETRVLELRVPQADARLRVLESDLAKKVVRAPFDGIVVREHTEIGEWLERGAPVATLVDLARVVVRLAVPESQIAHIVVGGPVDVVLPAPGVASRQGRVIAVGAEADSVTRTFPVLVDLPNGDGSLRAGLSARASLPSGATRRSLVVHKDALLLDGGVSSVFVLSADGVAARRTVTPGQASGHRVEILSGLQPGDRVVVRGNERLRPGLPTRVTRVREDVDGVGDVGDVGDSEATSRSESSDEASR